MIDGYVQKLRITKTKDIHMYHRSQRSQGAESAVVGKENFNGSGMYLKSP